MNRNHLRLLAMGLVTLASTAISLATANIVIPTSSKPYPAGDRRMHTNYQFWKGPWNRRSVDTFDPETQPNGVPASIQGYHPADIHAGYKIASGKGTAAIAIVDAFNYPTALNDFNVFASQFGLPQETSTDVTAATNTVFQIVYAQGAKPADDAGWAGEMALDIEWSHAMAPHAKIFLVEATDNGGDNLASAVVVAKNLPNVKEVSCSFGGGEYSSEASTDPSYYKSGVVVFASTGDSGAAREYPSLSPNVVAVGGTSVNISSSGVVLSETAWNSGGGGPSAYQPRPSFQSSVAAVVGNHRAGPDIAAVADPATGVAFYDSFQGGGWGVVGGTSVASPVCAGIANARGSFAADALAEHNRIYADLGTSLLRDIKSGSNGFPAMTGYDMATGCGVPNGMYNANSGLSALPTSVNVYRASIGDSGSYSDGDVSSLQSVDGSFYSVSSVSSNLGNIAAMELTFQLPADPNGGFVATFGVGLTESAVDGASSSIFMYNWATGRYDLKTSVALKTATATTTTTVAGFSPYIDGSGNVKVLLRAVNAVRAPRGGSGSPVPFTYQVDQAQLLFNYSD